MRVIARQTLIKFWQIHPDVKPALDAWCKEAEHACWQSPNDVRERYRSADFLADNRVVFNIKGNAYRLIASVDYDKQRIFIRFVGTHEEYDRIDAETV